MKISLKIHMFLRKFPRVRSNCDESQISIAVSSGRTEEAKNRVSGCGCCRHLLQANINAGRFDGTTVGSPCVRVFYRGRCDTPRHHRTHGEGLPIDRYRTRCSARTPGGGPAQLQLAAWLEQKIHNTHRIENSTLTLHRVMTELCYPTYPK